MGDFNYPGVDWLGGNHGGGASPEGVLFAECLENNFYEQFVYQRAGTDGRIKCRGGTDVE